MVAGPIYDWRFANPASSVRSLLPLVTRAHVHAEC